MPKISEIVKTVDGIVNQIFSSVNSGTDAELAKLVTKAEELDKAEGDLVKTIKRYAASISKYNSTRADLDRFATIIDRTKAELASGAPSAKDSYQKFKDTFERQWAGFSVDLLEDLDQGFITGKLDAIRNDVTAGMSEVVSGNLSPALVRMESIDSNFNSIYQRIDDFYMRLVEDLKVN